MPNNPSNKNSGKYLSIGLLNIGLAIIPTISFAEESLLACGASSTCWVAGGTADWGTSSNWTAGVPGTTEQIAEFLFGTTGSTITLTTAEPSIFEILFDSGASAFTFDIGTSSAVGSLTINGTATGAGITNNSGQFQNFAISSGSTLTLAGSSSLDSNSSAEVAVTVASGGSLYFQATAQGGKATVTNNGTFDLSAVTSGTMNIGAITGSGNVFLGGNKLTFTFGPSTITGNITDGGVAGGTGGSIGIANTGSGTIILDGVNTYTGSTTVTEGGLQIGDSTHTTASVTSNITLSSGTSLTVYGTASGSVTNSGDVTVESGGLISGAFSSGGAFVIIDAGGTISGAMTLTNTTIVSNAGTISSPTIANSGTGGGLTVSGAGTISSVITQTNEAELLYFASSNVNALANSQVINNSTSANALDISYLGDGVVPTPTTTIIGSLSGSGAVDLGSYNLQLGSLNLTDNISGVIQDGGLNGGTGGSITKIGTGTLTLSGANTYTGSTLVSSGTLAVTGSIKNTTTTTVASGATLNVTGAGSLGALVNNGTASYNTTTTVAQSLTNNGSLTFAGATIISATGGSLSNASTGTVYFQGTSSSTGALAITNAGTIYFQGSSNFSTAHITNTGSIYFQTATVSTISNITNNGLIDISGITAASVDFTTYNDSTASRINLGSKEIIFGGPGDTITVNGSISGTGGSLTVDAGTSGNRSNVNLYGINTYTGTTEVQAYSTLTIGATGSGAAAASVAGPLLVDANGALVVNAVGDIGTSLTNNGTATIGAATIANTNIINNNTATLTGTTLNNSTVTNNSGMTFIGASLSGDALTNNATMSLASTTVSNSSFNNAGNTASIQYGDGITAVSATNTIFTNSGTSSTAVIDLAALNNATINNQSGTFTLTDTTAGNAAINNYAGATLYFTGTSTANSATVVNNGVLSIAGITPATSFVLANLYGSGNVSLGTKNLLLIPSGTDTVTGIISGTGSVTMAGSGTLVLDGVNLYTGGTLISSGILEVGDYYHQGVSASVTGLTTVAAGGTLAGYGTVGNVLNNGTLMPGGGAGTPAGTLSFTGNYVQATGAYYTVNIDPNANANNVDITGSATLNSNALLQVNTFSNPAAINHLYTILTADSGVSGTFNVVSKGPFFTQQVFYVPTAAPTVVEYLLTYNEEAIGTGATTPNEQAVADNIIATNGTVAINAALASLETPQQLSGFLNQLSGATYANQQVMLAQLDREFENQMARRIDAYQSCVTQDVRYYKKKKKNSYACNDQLLWFDLYGGNDQIKSSAGISGLSTNNFGLNLGGETPMANNTTIVGGGVGFVDYRGEARGYESASYNGDLYQFGTYLRQQIATNWRLGGALGYTIVSNNDVNRSIDNVVDAGQIISNYTTGLFSSQGRVSYRFNFVNGMNLQPLFGMIYQRVNAYSFDEVGLPGFDLQVTEKAYNSLRTQLGAEVDFAVNYYNLAPFIVLGWEHEFRDQHGSFQASFIGVDTPFEIVGAPLGREILTVQAGLAHVQRSYWEFGLSFEGRFSSGFSEWLTVMQLAYF